MTVDLSTPVKERIGAARSWLFTPASRPDRFRRAIESGADAIILDLEDAVSEADKVPARDSVLNFLAEIGSSDTLVTVRINSPTRVVGLEDLIALVRRPGRLACIVTPKVESADQILLLSRVLEDAGCSACLVALIESARGVARLDEIADAGGGLAALMFGAADYAADLGQRVGAFRPDHARAALVNAAAMAGLSSIDSPYFAIDREEELRVECAAARAFGFFGKAAIHPSHLATINSVLAPDDAELALARDMLAAATDGVGVLNGRMIDAAMMRWARRIAGGA